MTSLFHTLFGCCLRGSEQNKVEDREREPLIPSDSTTNTPVPPEIISSRSTVSDDQRNAALKQRLNNIVSSASHGMRSAPSQYAGYNYGPPSSGQTPSTSNPAPQFPAQPQSRAGSRRSEASSRRSGAQPRSNAQPPTITQQPGGAPTSSEPVLTNGKGAGATPDPPVTPQIISNLTHRVRTSLPGPGASSSSPSPDSKSSKTQLRTKHLEEEPERGRTMSGAKDVLDGRKSPVSKGPFADKGEYINTNSPNGRSPLRASNGGVGSFKIPDNDDELILQYD